MPFQVNNSHNIPVIEIRDKFLGSLEGAKFKETLDTLKNEGKKEVVVDLSRTDFIDSSGIGALIGGHTSLRKAGGAIRLSAMQSRIKSVFLMTKLLGSVFENYETAEEAVKSYAENPPEPVSETE